MSLSRSLAEAAEEAALAAKRSVESVGSGLVSNSADTACTYATAAKTLVDALVVLHEHGLDDRSSTPAFDPKAFPDMIVKFVQQQSRRAGGR